MKKVGSVKFSVKANTINPDGELNFTEVGVGSDKREAIIFAFGMVCSALTSEDENIGNIGNIDEAIDAISMVSIDVKGDIEKLINGEMESDYFSAHDSSSKIEFSCEDLEEASETGGYLKDLTWMETQS